MDQLQMKRLAEIYDVKLTATQHLINLKNNLTENDDEDEIAKQKKEIEIDLVDQKILKEDNQPFDFEIESFKKECLLNGYDDIALTLKKESKINNFEQKRKNITPWLY